MAFDAHHAIVLRDEPDMELQVAHVFKVGGGACFRVRISDRERTIDCLISSAQADALKEWLYRQGTPKS
jgi:hypothetical protein